MDGALKIRNLGSASARRQRIQERQIHQHLAHQERLDRKRHVMSEIQSIEGSADDSDDSTSSIPDLDYTAQTPSEPTVQTPEDRSSSSAYLSMSPTTYGTNFDMKKIKELRPSVPKLESRPRMQATLTTMADWNYDRFSVMLDPSEVEEAIAEAGQEESSSSDSDDELEEPCPIETATSVVYTVPTTRPFVISIRPSQDQSQPRKNGQTTAQQASSRRHVSEQLMMDSSVDGFRAGEAKLFQLSNSSHESIESGNNSGQVSRSVSLASHSESIVSSQTSQSDQSNKSPKRMSSLPLLFGNNKSGHSRMSSFKNLIRSSTVGPPSATSQSHASLQRQPSCATLETHFESRSSSMDVPQYSVPETAQPHVSPRAPSPSLSIPGYVTAIPASYPRPTQKEPQIRPLATQTQEVPSKPVSKFRSRSGSIGLALKSINSSIKTSDASAPPLPNGLVPSPVQVYNQQSLPSPPPLTPRHPRRAVTNYMPFPSGNIKPSDAGVGLGLRY